MICGRVREETHPARGNKKLGARDVTPRAPNITYLLSIVLPEVAEGPAPDKGIRRGAHCSAMSVGGKDPRTELRFQHKLPCRVDFVYSIDFTHAVALRIEGDLPRKSRKIL